MHLGEPHQLRVDRAVDADQQPARDKRLERGRRVRQPRGAPRLPRLPQLPLHSRLQRLRQGWGRAYDAQAVASAYGGAAAWTCTAPYTLCPRRAAA
eukprot:3933931-Prymnesium_polylepis.1